MRVVGGFKTMLISKTAESTGGDCLNYGCVPSKALIHIARQFRQAKACGEYGLATKGGADIGKIMASIKEKQEKHNLYFF